MTDRKRYIHIFNLSNIIIQLKNDKYDIDTQEPHPNKSLQMTRGSTKTKANPSHHGISKPFKQYIGNLKRCSNTSRFHYNVDHFGYKMRILVRKHSNQWKDWWH